MDQSILSDQEILLGLIIKMEQEALAEGIRDRGLYLANIYPRLKIVYEQLGFPAPDKLRLQFPSLLHKQILLINRDATQISTSQINESFDTYENHVNKIYPGYVIDTEGYSLEPEEKTMTYKFSDYIKVLKSKNAIETDLSAIQLFEEQIKDPLFFDSTEDIPKLAFISFPRSGNSFIRKLFESITGSCTGKDVKQTNLWNYTLQLIGFKGQGLVNDRVWMVASHSPDPVVPSADFIANRALIMVRNPIDCIVSLYALAQSQNHSFDIKNEFHLENPVYWNEFITYFINQWAGLISYWKERSLKEGIPIHFMRYEDLLIDPQPVLTNAFKFCLNLPDLENTFVLKRIKQVLSTEVKQAGLSYKPRKGQFGKNTQYYSDDQVSYIKQIAEEHLYYFGYVKMKDNATSFFKFDHHKEENLNQINGFKRQNEETLARLLKEGDKSYERRSEFIHSMSVYNHDIPFCGTDSGLNIEIIQ